MLQELDFLDVFCGWGGLHRAFRPELSHRRRPDWMYVYKYHRINHECICLYYIIEHTNKCKDTLALVCIYVRT